MLFTRGRVSLALLSLQPRPQGFSLKKWVGRESPGDEVAIPEEKWGTTRSLEFTVIFLQFLSLWGTAKEKNKSD